jgi:hypothetical protein
VNAAKQILTAIAAIERDAAATADDALDDLAGWVEVSGPETTTAIKHFEHWDRQTVLRRCGADRKTVQRWVDADAGLRASEMQAEDPRCDTEQAKRSAAYWRPIFQTLDAVLADLAEAYDVAGVQPGTEAGDGDQ